jgi:hypothetical protein
MDNAEPARDVLGGASEKALQDQSVECLACRAAATSRCPALAELACPRAAASYLATVAPMLTAHGHKSLLLQAEAVEIRPLLD